MDEGGRGCINVYRESEERENVYEDESMDNIIACRSAGYNGSGLRLYTRTNNKKASRDACCAGGGADVYTDTKAYPIADAKTGAAAQTGTSA